MYGSGQSVISADIALDSENYDYVLSWWVDGKEKKSTILPYEGSIYGGDLDDPKNVCLHIGGNGCAVVTLYENMGAMIFPVMRYFLWKRKSGILLQAFAGRKKVLLYALVESDHGSLLRILTAV